MSKAEKRKSRNKTKKKAQVGKETRERSSRVSFESQEKNDF